MHVCVRLLIHATRRGEFFWPRFFPSHVHTRTNNLVWSTGERDKVKPWGHAVSRANLDLRAVRAAPFLPAPVFVYPSLFLSSFLSSRPLNNSPLNSLILRILMVMFYESKCLRICVFYCALFPPLSLSLALLSRRIQRAIRVRGMAISNDGAFKYVFRDIDET